jgi:SAM-dependent methyltransferase
LSDLRYGSLPFDRAAGFYDQTRGLPAHFLDPLATTLIAEGGLAPGARVYEPGIGTGRIALPLARHGLRVYGLDLSRPMLDRLRANSAGLEGAGLEGAGLEGGEHGSGPAGAPRAAEADITRAPFPDGQFDAGVAVHVFHLVSGWRDALGELVRVLRPGAPFFHGGQPEDPGTFAEAFYEYSETLTRALGVPPLRVGARRSELEEALRELGGEMREVEVARDVYRVTPRFYLDEVARRTHSYSWRVPDEIFDEYLRQLSAWALDRCGDLDAPLEVPWRFVWQVWRFGAGA